MRLCYLRLQPFSKRFEAALSLVIAVLMYFELSYQRIEERFDCIDMHVHDLHLDCSREI